MPKIILFDINPEMTKAWFEEFGDVEIHTGDFRELRETNKYDNIALCSAGNSFGIMGGGLDLAIANYFPGVEEMVRGSIRDHYNGECNVGQGSALPLLEEQRPFRYLFYIPTMIAPIQLNNSFNVYLATQCAMRLYDMALARQSNIDTLAMPGFGGLCGGLPPKQIAQTMKLAIERHIKPLNIQTHGAMRTAYNELRKVCYGRS